MSQALIARLEAAEVGSRELDAEIARLISGNTVDHWFKLFGDLVTDDTVSKFTTSIDAAVSLAGRVLPGFWWTAGRCGLTCHASVGPDRAFIAEPDLSKYDAGFHADIPNPSTPELALCIAILRAKELT